VLDDATRERELALVVRDVLRFLAEDQRRHAASVHEQDQDRGADPALERQRLPATAEHGRDAGPKRVDGKPGGRHASLP
jgi:hypothetical protein